MGALRDLANHVFRNFRVDGDPSSGQHDPKKADIRNLFGGADDSLTASVEAVEAAAAVVTGGVGAIEQARDIALDDVAAELASAVGAIDATEASAIAAIEATEATAIAEVQVYAAALTGSSSSLLTIAVGPKTIVTQAGKQWALGQRLRAASSDGAIIIEGEVTSYSDTSLTIDADYTVGSGTHADWTISIAGARGAPGADGVAGEPIIILATGQSNIQRLPAYSWAPPTNLFLWNWDGNINSATDVGSAFGAMDSTRMGVAFSYAAEVARGHPAQSVYLINIGKDSQPIAKWMIGSPDPDMYAACKNNVEAALDVLGVEQITELLWWQGEADAQSGLGLDYVGNFNTVQSRFRDETWFSYTTPVIVMGVSAYLNDDLRDFILVQKELINVEPDCRTFVNTSHLPAAYWADEIHLDSAGYDLAGRLARVAASRGTTAAIVRGWNTVLKPMSTLRASITEIAADPHLRLPVKSGKTYLVKGWIRVASSVAGGFKWTFSGPSLQVSSFYSTWIQSGTTTLNSKAVNTPGGGYPPGESILAADTTPVFLEFTAQFYNMSSDGVLAFSWAQNTSDAQGATVAGASFLEYLEFDWHQF